MPSSVFYLGSVSKQFVTFSILLLEEEGKLNLDDKIQKFLPDFPVYESPLTIRHFIHHTSGVRDYLTLMDLMGRNYLDHIEDDEVYELIKRQSSLNFSPGEPSRSTGTPSYLNLSPLLPSGYIYFVCISLKNST